MLSLPNKIGWSNANCEIIFFFSDSHLAPQFLMISWWSILVANLVTNFQDLIAKVKNSVALVPVWGAISLPVKV